MKGQLSMGFVPATRRPPGRWGRVSGRRLLLYVVALAIAVVALFPVYWLGISSLRPDDQILTDELSLVPRSVTLEQYRRLFGGADFLRYIRNSLLVSLGTTLATIVISVPAAYSLCRLRYRGRKAISRLILISYMFPGVLLMVPLYLLLASMRLLNTLTGLTIVYVTWCAPFATWVLIAFFRKIPFELEEAAMVDGASRVGALWRVILPLATPGMVTAMIYSFVSSWNEFPLASVLLISDEVKTLPVGLAGWITMYTVEWGIVNAGAAVTALPIMLIFAVLGRRFVAGLTEGALKG